MVQYNCNQCENSLETSDSEMGRKYRCSKCGFIGVVPNKNLPIAAKLKKYLAEGDGFSKAKNVVEDARRIIVSVSCSIKESFVTTLNELGTDGVIGVFGILLLLSIFVLCCGCPLRF